MFVTMIKKLMKAGCQLIENNKITRELTEAEKNIEEKTLSEDTIIFAWVILKWCYENY